MSVAEMESTGVGPIGPGKRGIYLSIPVGDIAVSSNIRRMFDEEKLAELAESLKEYGVLQPLVVRMMDRQYGPVYELVAGERRLRAAKMAGLTEVPCRVVSLTAKQAAEVQLLENLQRADLNAMEEAQALKDLIAAHGYTQEALAKKLGKSQPWVASRVKMLELPDSVQRGITRGIVNVSAAEVLSRYAKAAPDVIIKVVESMKDTPIPVAKLRDEVDWRVAQRCRPLSGHGYERPLFDPAPCIASCEKAIFVRDYGTKVELPRCADPKCWEAKNQVVKEEAAKRARENVGDNGINLDALGGAWASCRDYEWAQNCPAGCEHRKQGYRKQYDGNTEMVDACLDPKCFNERREAFWAAERKARDDERQATLERYLRAAKAVGLKRDLALLPHQALVSLGALALAQAGWRIDEIGYTGLYREGYVKALRKLDAMPHADVVGLIINTVVEKMVRNEETVPLNYLLGQPLPECDDNCDECQRKECPNEIDDDEADEEDPMTKGAQ